MPRGKGKGKCYKCKQVGCTDDSHAYRNIAKIPCGKCGDIAWRYTGRCGSCETARLEAKAEAEFHAPSRRFRLRAVNQRKFRARDVGQRAVRRGRGMTQLHGTAVYYEYRLLWWELGMECPLLAGDFKRLMDGLGEDVRATLDWVTFAPYLVRIDDSRPMGPDNVRVEVRRLTAPYEDITEMPEGWV